MTSTILLSGGVGSRSGMDIPKQYCKLKGKTIFTYCVEEIVNAGLTEELIIVYGDGYLSLINELLEPFIHHFKSLKFTTGGSTRQASVYNGLKLCSGEIVVLHESARPLITADDLILIRDHVSENVTMGQDIHFTVLKKKNGKITSILKREELFNVQLPQKFNLQQLLAAHKRAEIEGRTFTDDSSMVFTYSGDVSVIDGSVENIKITTPNDFLIAEEILDRREQK